LKNQAIKGKEFIFAAHWDLKKGIKDALINLRIPEENIYEEDFNFR